MTDAVFVCSEHDAACAEVPSGLRCASCPLGGKLQADEHNDPPCGHMLRGMRKPYCQRAANGAMTEAPWTPKDFDDLAAAFTRSADWLEKGLLHGPARTHPLVGLADYRKAAEMLSAAKTFWQTSNTEG